MHPAYELRMGQPFVVFESYMQYLALLGCSATLATNLSPLSKRLLTESRTRYAILCNIEYKSKSGAKAARSHNRLRYGA